MEYWYHIRVGTRSEADLSYRLDLSRAELMEAVLSPLFVQRRSVVIQSRVIRPERVGTIRVSRTDKPSAQLLPVIKKRLMDEFERSASNGFFNLQQESAEWHLVEEGTNVTDEVMAAATQGERERRAAKAIKSNESGGSGGTISPGPPRHGTPNRVNRAAVGILTQVVASELGWILREQPVEDYGVDAHMEIVQEGQPTAHLIAVQLKAGPHCFKEETDEGFVYRGTLPELEYWLHHSLPVILVLCDIETRTCFWQAVTDRTVKRLGKGWKVTVPRARVLDGTATTALEALCERKEDETADRIMDARHQDMADRWALHAYLEDNRLGK